MSPPLMNIAAESRKPGDSADREGVTGARRQDAAPRVSMLKTILVPVDFSACSLKSLTYAVALAKQFGASVILLHVVEPLRAGSRFASPEDHVRLRHAAERALAELARHEVLPHVEASPFVREGVPGQAITDFARMAGVDLIVIATHGYTGLKRVLLGSTAQRVVLHASCPVLVVRERQHEFVAATQEAEMESP